MKKINVLIIEKKTSLMDPKAEQKIEDAGIVLIKLKSGNYEIHKDKHKITFNKSTDEINKEIRDKNKYLITRWESKRY